MKKLIIAALVGAIIHFLYQFLSWAMLDLHHNNQSYTPQQDEIYECIKGKLPTGEYMIPRLPKGASADAGAKFQAEMAGQPWMLISYYESFDVSLPMNFSRALIANFLAVFLLAWLLMKIPNLTMGTAVSASIAIGVMGYFTSTYIENIWFDSYTIMHFVDSIVPWALTGAFVGWYFGRNR